MFMGDFGFLASAEAFIEVSSSPSSSSLSAWTALKDKARRNLPLRPPLRIMLELGVSSIAARSLSSRDIRFSEAVNVPCDKGEGRTGRWEGVDEAGDGELAGEDDVEVRLDVALELDEEEEGERLWGGGSRDWDEFAGGAAAGDEREELEAGEAFLGLAVPLTWGPAWLLLPL